jgi:guanylate kinase
MDSNPRHFFIDAVKIEANVDADQSLDYVTIEFAGRVTPTVRQRIEKALCNGDFTIMEKRLA